MYIKWIENHNKIYTQNVWTYKKLNFSSIPPLYTLTYINIFQIGWLGLNNIWYI